LPNDFGSLKGMMLGTLELAPEEADDGRCEKPRYSSAAS
jgi:hypothetical protein